MIENKSPSQAKIKLSVNLWSQKSLATLFVAGASFVYRALANSQAPRLIALSYVLPEIEHTTELMDHLG